MLFIYYLTKPVNWIIPWILQAIVYYRIMKKNGAGCKMGDSTFYG